jgi:hypothetical protein
VVFLLVGAIIGSTRPRERGGESDVAHHYRIDQSQRLATLTFGGSVSGTELAQATRTLYEDPMWAAGFDAIWDFRSIEELLLEKDDIRSLVELDASYADLAAGGRDIFIVARALDYAMGRIYAHFAKDGPRQSQMVRSPAEAWEALGRVAPTDPERGSV